MVYNMYCGSKMAFIIGVNKSYWTRSKRIRTRPRAKKHWKVSYYDDSGVFGTRFIPWFKVPYWKIRQMLTGKIRTFQCDSCGLKYKSNKERCPVCLKNV